MATQKHIKLNSCCELDEIDIQSPCINQLPSPIIAGQSLTFDIVDGDQIITISDTISYSCCNFSQLIKIISVDTGGLPISLPIIIPEEGFSFQGDTYSFTVRFNAGQAQLNKDTSGKIIVTLEVCGQIIMKEITVLIINTCVDVYPPIIPTIFQDLDIYTNDGDTITFDFGYPFDCCSGDETIDVLSIKILNDKLGLTLTSPSTIPTVIEGTRLSLAFLFNSAQAIEGIIDFVDIEFQLCDNRTFTQRIQFTVINSCVDTLPTLPELDLEFFAANGYVDNYQYIHNSGTLTYTCCDCDCDSSNGGIKVLGTTDLDSQAGLTLTNIGQTFFDKKFQLFFIYNSTQAQVGFTGTFTVQLLICGQVVNQTINVTILAPFACPGNEDFTISEANIPYRKLIDFGPNIGASSVDVSVSVPIGASFDYLTVKLYYNNVLVSTTIFTTIGGPVNLPFTKSLASPSFAVVEVSKLTNYSPSEIVNLTWACT